jgi:hypothetical protein
MASSLRLASPGESLTATDVLGRFDPTLLPSSPTVLDARGST